MNYHLIDLIMIWSIIGVFFLIIYVEPHYEDGGGSRWGLAYLFRCTTYGGPALLVASIFVNILCLEGLNSEETPV